MHKYANVRYLILEISPADAFLYNHYLNTGEEEYLLNNIYAYIKDERIFWQALYRFNKSLPKDDKIEVFGIDYHTKGTFLQAMALMFWNGNSHEYLPKELAYVSKKIAKTAKRLKGFDKLKQLIKKDFRKQPQIYKKYLGDYYWYFRQIIDNPLKEKHTDEIRDKEMANHTLNIIKKHIRGNIFGALGRYHTEKYKTRQNLMFFLLNQKVPILNINAYYKDCNLYSHGKKINHTSTQALYPLSKKDLAILEKYICQPITLINTNHTFFKRFLLLRDNKFMLYIKNQGAYTYEDMEQIKNK
ncbi:hypothetical protein [uncultured Microscilla sp.]|uniref:hypothetical protein n=1 Tax=uncultured Microscilla sp. TaxID=432653 RepID=UPI002634F465|nr:hypothetical protein [uncultured Microscilla sp.]